MKLVEMKCPACNGTVKLDPDHPGEAVCEYCKTRYLVEQESGDEYRLDNYWAGGRNIPPQTNQEIPKSYVPRQNRNAGVRTLPLICGLIGCFAVFLIGGLAMYKVRSSSVRALQAEPVVAEAVTDETEAGTEAEKAFVWSKGMERVVYAIYGRLPDQVDAQELGKLRYLELEPGVWEIESDRRFFRMKYGLEGDLGPDGEMAIHTYEEDFPPEISRGADMFDDYSCLKAFTGLETLVLDARLKPGDLAGLSSLETLGINYIEPAEVAAMVDDPGQIKELVYEYNQASLAGLEVFTGLERLELHGSDDLRDIKDLAALKNLKALTLEYCPSLTDFSVLFTMSGLTELHLDVEGVKDISFVGSMPELTSFTLDDGSCISIDPLADCQNLTELGLIDNYDLPDYSAITGLTGLTSLRLEKYTNQPDPDLSGMSGMRSLNISGFNTCSFLRSMSGLEELTIAGYGVDDPGAFSGLTQLKRLKGTKSWEYLNSVSFLAELPALTELDLAGTTFYTDISPVLNKEGLKSLNLNHASAEINFSRLKDNPGLEALFMNNLKLYRNVKVERMGGISMVDWDNVSMDAELGFLSHYPGLTELSIADNKLSQIQAVASLPYLERLDIGKNYVTDLNPLSGLEHLKWIDGRENPVSNWQVVGEKTAVIK